ncbi:MAG: UDP-N-acetylglucosamine--N-acetylmuramyl-(pentapeptide) pyrophosphoryl-undecaprenol N-acetylglucosamine transferase [Candidatus Pacebacteria bacterium]|nr:UDP-N-acetylglucosamine--N-acetylmuramyl-(pentapeptide) pyrophosphoryl-undecaprenol N-acetylglucosamine transferase [Candidatus Paceibacterota bacterium]
MRILFTGGGTGGHFYPIIAIAEALNKIVDEEKILKSELYYMSTEPYDKQALFENNIKFVQVNAGKLRIYPSVKNITDMFKTATGCMEAIFKIFALYPDVIFGKGGFASFPALFAAKILRIPVIIHESDSAPGRVNKWASKFAKRIAISFPEAIDSFPKNKTAWTGQPVRRDIARGVKEGAHEYFGFDQNIPVILILGGSQGAQKINNALIDALPALLPNFQIIHQVGPKNLEDITQTANVIIANNEFKKRYKPIGFLNPLGIKMAAGAANIVVSRAGSTIFEIAGWGVPAIIIPFDKSNGDHSRKNAYTYARSGAGEVMEETNLSPNLLVAEIEKLVGDSVKIEAMKKAALSFARPDAANTIAREIINIALKHEQ